VKNSAKGKFWNLGVKRGADGGKHLDIQLHGVIDGGWYDDAGVDTSALIAEMQQHLDAKTVGVRINSVGGSAFGGVALYNALQAHPGEVTSTVEGLAASAASLVAMAGKTVMGRGAMMMIHSPSTIAIGNAAELRKTADVLDKVQDSLATIYTEKTGKSLDEVNGLLDDETWMTADEAVAAGFADVVGEDDDQQDATPKMVTDSVIWRGVKFPSAAMPREIMLMAQEKTPPTVVAASAPPPALAVVPPPAVPAPLSRAEIELRAPEIIKAIAEEGHAKGVAAERARLNEIDDVGFKGGKEIVNAAKYGEKPTNAAELALALAKAGELAGADMLATRRLESAVLAAVTTGTPDQGAASTEEQRAIKFMADRINARRGGSK
jgi:ATP-dependent Clp protease protease subunit